MGIRGSGVSWFCGALLALAACEAEPALVASNCAKGEECVSKAALKIDAVDILLVIDNSASTAFLGKRLKDELPRLLNAVTHGEGEDEKFPPAKSVHIAVATPDMGAGENSSFFGCDGWGRDGKFVKPNEFGLTCDVQYPGYLAFEGGPASVATVDSVGCVPLVTPLDGTPGPDGFGCGFEQPLEASLKALSKKDSKVDFVQGAGHADGDNAGFLRDNSLLVVVIVSDEDDCSASDYAAFDPESEANAEQSVNLYCQNNKNKLFDPARYVEHLKKLRPDNENVIFAAIAGVPTQLTDAAYRAKFDLTTDEGVRAYYDSLLDAPEMQEQIAKGAVGMFDGLVPSCKRPFDFEQADGTRTVGTSSAFPPRRLLEVAKGFGSRSVVESFCADDFGTPAGRLIRAIGEQLTAANEN